MLRTRKLNLVTGIIMTQRHFKTLLILFLIAGSCANAWALETGALPETCTSACVTPYGEVLGTTADGLKAFSNCQANCVVFDPNQENGIYTGIKWQCVEFTRRWLIHHHGLTFGDVDVAADMWKLPFFTRLRDKSEVAIKTYENGSTSMPRHGDLLIYAKEYLGTGHAAVVLEVDLVKDRIRVAEQNYKNQNWTGHYARKIDLINKSGRYWLLDAYLLGWIRTQ